jgi:arabinose-5-phosphate isomerase
MSAQPARASLPLNASSQLELARQIIRDEGSALLDLADSLGNEFCQAAELVYRCTGSVIVSGMGKAGLIGQKVAATLASTGTRSHFLHPGEAVHGDLGRIHSADVVLMLSYSGRTEEVVRLLPAIRELRVPLIAVTGEPNSQLAREATVVLTLGSRDEACPLNLAPSTSTTSMLALGDALALVVSQLRGFTAEDFARYHPGGSLGLKLARVEDVMRPATECRVATTAQTVRAALVAQSRPGRRTGAILVVDENGCLAGIFTDSDLVRLLEHNRDGDLDGPITGVMTAHPLTVNVGTRLAVACEVLAQRKISELPVIDDQSRLVGMIDITDVVTAPAKVPSPSSKSSTRPALRLMTDE